jgi:hypothetical protein
VDRRALWDVYLHGSGRRCCNQFKHNLTLLRRRLSILMPLLGFPAGCGTPSSQQSTTKS